MILTKAATIIATAVILSITVQCIEGYRILAVMPHQGKSHFFLFEPLFKALAQKGHQITVMSHFPQKTKIVNYTDVDLSISTNRHLNQDFFDLNDIPPGRVAMHLTSAMIAKWGQQACETSMNQNKELKAFLQIERSFDVILMEMFNSDCFLSIAQRYPAPLIALTAGLIIPWVDPRFGNPATTSHVPVMFTDFSGRMTFLERLENTFALALNRMTYYFMVAGPNQVSTETFFKNNIEKNITVNLKEVAYNASLLFLCTHHSLHGARPLVPSIIEVGGIHLRKPKKLPVDIEKWIEEAKDGVIVFSFGSMIKGHTFPEDKRRAFQNALRRLPQKVIWKWENETMFDKPDNVKIVKWLPQLDILCHPNVKAFISHGGLLGLTEAIHCGVPILTMPQFGDQHANARAVQESGGGIVVQFYTATEEIIYNALVQILQPSFHEKAKDLSETFNDRPMPPLETAIYWTEYVARHKGAPRMRSASVGMPYYQYLLLDVIAFLLAISGVFAYIAWKCCGFVYAKFCSRTQNKVKSS